MANPEPKTRPKGLRSPNFPSIDLGAAIARAKVIYGHERRAPTRDTVILKHLGYAAERRSGVAGRVLSALLQYGLLEKHGNGLYRLTDDANRILNLSEGAPERQKALQDCATRPSLFRELLTTYKDGLPSDATLRDQLIANRGFNPTSVGQFVQVFRATLEIAKVKLGGDYGAAEGADEGASEDVQDDPNRAEQVRTGVKPPLPPGEKERLRFTLSGERGVRIIFSGPDPTQAEIDELMDYLKVSRRTFPAAHADES